ncbi:DUF397 domain-containing protein [Streptomyces sp. NPDC004609]|uniref:DUF397 domain-containing protein n=1 Tax=Streptomyces sp. NPDC004609 TaxID=3364704 RepID=UPI0036933D1D
MAPGRAWFKSSYSDGTGNNCIEVAWFKSSYSGDTGNDCVEVAWLKSSYSGGTGNSCVEVSDLTTHIGVRDSKDVQRPALVVPAAAWSSFVTFAAGSVSP